MPSLVNTWPRWYRTVRELMNRRVPISGFDRPSRASRATWASWAVSGWLAGPGGVRAGWAVRLRLSRPIEDTSLTVGEDSRDEPPQLGIEVKLAELLVVRHQLKRAHDEVGDLFQIQLQECGEIGHPGDYQRRS